MLQLSLCSNQVNQQFTCNVGAGMKNKERCRRRLPMDVNDESGSKMKRNKINPGFWEGWYRTFNWLKK